MPGSTSVDADGKHPRPVRGPTTRPSATIAHGNSTAVTGLSRHCRASTPKRRATLPRWRKRATAEGSFRTNSTANSASSLVQPLWLRNTTTPRRHKRGSSTRRWAAAARGAGWAWFGGGDGFVLATVPSEASFLGGLGMWVAGMAVVSGFGMTVAAGQWWSTSIVNVLWVLPVWAVLYCLIERLVLKSFGTSKLWNLVPRGPATLLSLAIALVVGLPMAQVIYSGSINDELEDDDCPDPPGDERDHAGVRDEDRRRAEGDRGGSGQGGKPPAPGHEQQVPRRL